MDIVIRVLERHGGYFPELRAAKAQHIFLFLALRFGNDDDGPIATGIGDQCQTDAGVARGSLDDNATRFDVASCLGIENNVLGGAILYRTARIGEFAFRQNVASGLLGCFAESDKRCVTYRVDKIFSKFHAVAASANAFH